MERLRKMTAYRNRAEELRTMVADFRDEEPKRMLDRLRTITTGWPTMLRRRSECISTEVSETLAALICLKVVTNRECQSPRRNRVVGSWYETVSRRSVLLLVAPLGRDL
jgi:hypothetical protein